MTQSACPRQIRRAGTPASAPALGRGLFVLAPLPEDGVPVLAWPASSAEVPAAPGREHTGSVPSAFHGRG